MFELVLAIDYIFLNVSYSWYDQSVEWNEEPTEEQGGTESPAVAADEVYTPNIDKKEDNLVSSNEENEWDRLLRVR